MKATIVFYSAVFILLEIKQVTSVASDATLFDAIPQYLAPLGQTAEIPCLYGEGKPENISWYHNNNSGWVQVLFLFNGSKNTGSSYTEDRVDIDKYMYTLTIRNVVIPDEGQYRCEVDRQNNNSVVYLYSELNVIVIPEYKSPAIRDCETTQELEQCDIRVHVNTPTELSCELRGFHPSADASLEWRREDGSLLEAQTIVTTKNTDGTSTLNTSASIRIGRPERFWCNASFVSVQGIETAGTPVLLLTDTPSSNIVLAVALPIGLCVCLAGVLIAVYYRYHRNGSCKLGSKLPIDSEKMEDTEISEQILYGLVDALGNHANIPKLAVNLGFKNTMIQHYVATNQDHEVADCKGTCNMLFDWKIKTPESNQSSNLRTALIDSGFGHLADIYCPVRFQKENVVGRNLFGKESRHDPKEYTALLPQQTGEEAAVKSEWKQKGTHSMGQCEAPILESKDISGSDSQEVTDEDIQVLSKLLSQGHFDALCSALKIPHTAYDDIRKKNPLIDFPTAYVEILQKWKTDNGGGTYSQMNNALITADAVGLIDKYKKR